ncbi:hypothetical protein I5U18_03260 [Serratia ureilytica]|uniref:hypothetical protein n=1 Tax=Serratia ureilytica TaxID=300181 RepID=UPI0018D2DC11|nr:hypothetical protein [Serratia ureilytica]MBH1909588.1 hypothetical protein [Serratia ureilytica]
MNTYEMEGFLRGQCVPRDLLVNESNAAYLVRKLSEIASVKAERDALADRVNALAVENAALKSSVDLIASAYTEGEPAGFEIDRARHIETPVTDAALVAIQAQGIEKFAKALRVKGDDAFFDAIAEAQANAADEFAANLREAK